MPIYEYRRPDGTTLEIQQSFSEEPLKVDPDTGVPLERVFHAPAVHFKGKGFYNTDYGTRNRQRETAASAEKSNAEKSSAEKSSSSESSSGSSASSDGAGKTEKAAKKSSENGGATKREAKPVAGKS